MNIIARDARLRGLIIDSLVLRTGKLIKPTLIREVAAELLPLLIEVIESTGNILHEELQQ